MGLAASMASYIALAADKRTAHDNAVYMIHNVLGLSIGDHRELRATADNFEKMSNLLAREYAKVTGMDIAEVRGMMDDETFLFGDEIAEKGFVHEIIQTGKEDDKEEAVAVARTQFEDCVAQMKSHEQSVSDITQVAAYLNTAEPVNEIKPIINETEEEEGQSMNLEEFLASNPEAHAQYKGRIEAAKKEGEQSVQARVDKCAAVLGAEYPKAIGALAVKVLRGEEEPAALTGAVAVFDAQEEARAEAEAAAAGEETPPAAPKAGASEDGTITSEEEYQAELNRAKGGQA